MKKPLIKIDVVSDVVCPWCYIGKRRLEKAMDGLKAEMDFEVEFYPFELNPSIPSEGIDQKKYLSEKFGGEDRYNQITAHTTRTAAQEGLHFDFAKQKISPNTFQSHRLIAFARLFGKQAAMNEALMRAYFEKGTDLTQNENLVAMAAEVGLNPDDTRKFLASQELSDQIKQQEQLNYQRGISGVPYFIINGKYGLSGAQPVEVFTEALREIVSETNQGESCSVEGVCTT
ncbi:MAG: DsbA family oxidoreductase [Bacteroidetes bacterium]|nr:DsbA family oxidoreductase [Bacteroidota bacterium]MBS1541776.1 DsbA family oxidoreductase [Bacteroidota bacterium]